MRELPLHTRVLQLLQDRSAFTARAMALQLKAEPDQVQQELETLFVGSRVECRRQGDPLYRLPAGGALVRYRAV